MKKYLAILALSVVLTGCGGDGKSQTETTLAQTEAETKEETTAETKEEMTAEAQESPKAGAEGGEGTQAAEAGIEPKPGMPLQKGNKAPDFTAELLDGTTLTLSDYKGKPVIINFWATWCGPCVKEMPAFERLKEDFGDEIGIIAVNSGDDTETVKDFAEENGYTFPIALDEDFSISMLYPTNGIPYTVILDAEGNVTHISTGALDADTMYEKYKEALGL